VHPPIDVRIGEFVALAAQLSQVPWVRHQVQVVAVTCPALAWHDAADLGLADYVVNIGVTFVAADLALASDLPPVSSLHREGKRKGGFLNISAAAHGAPR